MSGPRIKGGSSLSVRHSSPRTNKHTNMFHKWIMLTGLCTFILPFTENIGVLKRGLYCISNIGFAVGDWKNTGEQYRKRFAELGIKQKRRKWSCTSWDMGLWNLHFYWMYSWWTKMCFIPTFWWWFLLITNTHIKSLQVGFLNVWKIVNLY